VSLIGESADLSFMDISPLTCNSQQLYTIVSGSNLKLLRLSLSNPVMTEDHVIALLRNSMVTPNLIQEILDRLDWASSYKVQMAVVSCPKTGHALALRFLRLLYWNDLVKIIANPRLNPRLRRAAEKQLYEKVRELTIGEKTTIARTGPRAVIHLLLEEEDVRIVQALLRNPNMIEDDVVVLVNDELTSSEILTCVGSDYKWSTRYSIRLALVRNNKTPLPVALSFLSKLRKSDLRALNKAPATRELIKRTAYRILEGRY
jgi:hypothetical protein